MKYYLLFSIKRGALDFERLFFCSRFGLLIKTLLHILIHTKIEEENAFTHGVINLDLCNKC